jgi:hypothetical protein
LRAPVRCGRAEGAPACAGAPSRSFGAPAAASSKACRSPLRTSPPARHRPCVRVTIAWITRSAATAFGQAATGCPSRLSRATTSPRALEAVVTGCLCVGRLGRATRSGWRLGERRVAARYLPQPSSGCSTAPTRCDPPTGPAPADALLSKLVQQVRACARRAEQSTSPRPSPSSCGDPLARRWPTTAAAGDIPGWDRIRSPQSPTLRSEPWQVAATCARALLGVSGAKAFLATRYLSRLLRFERRKGGQAPPGGLVPTSPGSPTRTLGLRSPLILSSIEAWRRPAIRRHVLGVWRVVPVSGRRAGWTSRERCA